MKFFLKNVYYNIFFLIINANKELRINNTSK